MKVMIRVIKHAIVLSILIIQSSCYVFLFQNPSKVTFSQLHHKYSVNLDTTWTKEQAEMLLNTYESIYQRSPHATHSMTPSAWKMSNEDIQDDVLIETVDSVKHITISSDVFSNGESLTQNTQDEFLYNKRLFRIVAQVITDDWANIDAVKLILNDGTDRFALELVLKEMYGLSLVRNDTPEADKIRQKLRKYVGEVKISQFTNQELMMLMSIYEKFPVALRRIPRLKYLLRSQQAPYAGSAWIIADCVEYSARTFRIKNQNEFQRVILHEKAHFLWEYALNGKLRKTWSELGGWQKDSTKKYGWTKTKERKEFVTDYAYSKNPNEDWAESVAYYLIHPNKLRLCSLAKYEFIDQAMRMYNDGSLPFKRLKDLNTY